MKRTLYGTSIGAMAAIAAAGMLGVGAPIPERTIRPEPPRIVAPSYAVKTKRQNRKIEERQRRKARRAAEAQARQSAGFQNNRRLNRANAASELQRVINAMTNHERHQWSRFCGQDQRKRHDIEIARRFQAPLARAMRSAGSGQVNPSLVLP